MRDTRAFELLGWSGRARLEAGGEDTLLLLTRLSGDVTHKLDVSSYLHTSRS